MPPEKTNMAILKSTMNEDVFPIEHEEFSGKSMWVFRFFVVSIPGS